MTDLAMMPEETLALLIDSWQLPKPERQYRWRVGRRWRADFAWPSRKLLLECQGAVFARGRHTRGKGYTRDCVKLNEAQLAGWRILWVTPGMIDDGSAIEFIKRALEVPNA